MVYYVTKTPPRYHHPTIDELLFEPDDKVAGELMMDHTSTTTKKVDTLPQRILGSVDLYGLLYQLEAFNKKYDHLRKYPRERLYRHFTIKKDNGKNRPIDEPNPELKEALRELRQILDPTNVMYHTAAFAYVPHRSTADAARKHQQNDSWWKAHYDMSNFFPSITLDYTMKIFSMLFPYSELMKWDKGKDELTKAMELCFLRGGLPQGSPLSPTLTNIIMIPFDYELSEKLRRFHAQNYVYTRYADDLVVSSKYGFDHRRIERLIEQMLKDFNAPFHLNYEKTTYNSKNGRNWILGVMLNRENKITIGHKAKKIFKAKLSTYAVDKLNGNMWDLKDLRSLQGYMSHYRSIERDFVDDILSRYSGKYRMNIERSIMDDIKYLSNF